MPRRVWSKVDVPSGWVQIVRGPRPKSEQWPRRVTMPEHQPSVAQKSPVSRPPQAFARSAKEKVNPDVARCAALTQLQKLEKALEVMGDAEGPAVDALKLELDKARRAAKVAPLSVQIPATQEFIKRSEKRLMDLEEERKAEAELLQDAKERLAQLEVANRAEANVSAPPAPPPTWAQEMEVLKARLSSVEEERDAAVRATACKRRAPVRSTSSTDIPLMPVHVPKDLDDWMCDRNMDLQEALSVGSGPRVSMLIAKQSEGAAPHIRSHAIDMILVTTTRQISLQRVAWSSCG